MDAMLSEIQRLKKELRENYELNQRLQCTIKELRKSSAKVTGTNSSEESNSQPFDLLGLPSELRAIILEYCLVVGIVYLRARDPGHTLSKGYEFAPKPQWQLLSVSHQIRDEAMKILLSQNHFVLSHAVVFRSLFFNPDLDEEQLDPHQLDKLSRIALSSHVAEYLRSASIILDPRSIVGDPLNYAGKLHWTVMRYPNAQGISYDQMPDHAKLAHIHNAMDTMDVHWRSLCIDLNMTRVEHLEVDLSMAYSPIGCYRWINQAADAIACLFDTAYHNCPAKRVVEILGTKNAAGRRLIMKRIAEAAFTRTIEDFSEHTVQFKSSKVNENTGFVLARDGIEAGLEDEEVNLGAEVMKCWKGLTPAEQTRYPLFRGDDGVLGDNVSI